MREYTHNVSGYLSGLRPDPRLHRNTPYTEEAINVIVTQHGMEEYEGVTFPFLPATVPVTSPWPQLVRGKGKTLLFDDQSVLSVNELSVPWSVSNIATYSINGIDILPITGVGVWHFLDMQNAWYAFNGVSTVFQTGAEVSFDWEEKVFVQSDVKINTGCYHRGRAIIGGFDASLWNPHWDFLFAKWEDGRPSTTDFQAGLGKNYIIWSGVGAGDFPLWLFYPDVYPYQVEPSEENVIRELMKNGFGILPMPGQGDVLVIKELGDKVVVYQDDSVHILQMYSNQYASGYSVESSLRVGAFNRGSVCGDDSLHFFIDTAGDIWMVSVEGYRRLGFAEYLLPELSSDLRLSYDDKRGRVYLSSDKSYVLSPGDERYELTEITEKITSLAFVAGGLVGVVEESAEIDADYIYITTNAFDMELRSLKTLKGVEIGIDTTHDAYAAIEFKYNKGEDWITSNWHFLNKEGYAFFTITGVEFRLKIKVEGKSNVRIDYAYVKWQIPDKRYIRGFFQQASTQIQG